MTNPAAQALTAEEITQRVRALSETGSKQEHKITCRSCQKTMSYYIDVVSPELQFKVIQWAHENGYGKPGTHKDEETKVDLGVDPYTLNADELRQHRQAIAKAYPEAANALSKHSHADHTHHGPQEQTARQARTRTTSPTRRAEQPQTNDPDRRASTPGV